MDDEFVINELNDNNLKVLNSHITFLKSHLILLQNNMKLVIKNIQKENKQLKKENKQLKNKITKSKKSKKINSGFAAPKDISHKLAKFIDVPYGTKLSRTFVTQYIHNYIKLNGLQDKDNKRKINPDEKLNDLFEINKLGNNIELHFFNIQKFLNPHFI